MTRNPYPLRPLGRAMIWAVPVMLAVGALALIDHQRSDTQRWIPDDGDELGAFLYESALLVLIAGLLAYHVPHVERGTRGLTTVALVAVAIGRLAYPMGIASCMPADAPELCAVGGVLLWWGADLVASVFIMIAAAALAFRGAADDDAPGASA